ncbi:MAG: hypothetical protein ACYCUM_03445 [Solirubrobacteraceae bacterium]
MSDSPLSRPRPHASESRPHPELERLRNERERLRREREAKSRREAAPPQRGGSRYGGARSPYGGARHGGVHARADAAEAGALGGGTEGNRRLTAQTGAVLIVLFAIIGITILRITQLITIHLFVGMLMIGPVSLKMMSTGYRFSRYYTRNPRYRRAGSPPTLLRMLAPLVIFTTIGVFASGIALMLGGLSSRPTLFPLHRDFFIAWLLVTGVHVLGHVAELPSALGGNRFPALMSSAERYNEAAEMLPGMRRPVAFDADPAWDAYGTGSTGRVIAIGGVLLAGLVLAVVSISWYGSWRGF